MEVVYRCSFCGKEYYNKQKCSNHELSHFANMSKIIKDVLGKGKEVCDYCDHSYYVYGCERDCDRYKECRNKNSDYKDFVPTLPLRNKKKELESENIWEGVV